MDKAGRGNQGGVLYQGDCRVGFQPARSDTLYDVYLFSRSGIKGRRSGSRILDFIGISKKRPEGFCRPFKPLEVILPCPVWARTGRDGARMLLPIMSIFQKEPAWVEDVTQALRSRIECHPLKTNAPQSAGRLSDRQPDLSMAPKIICRIPGEGWQVNAQNCKSNSAAWDNGRDIDPHPCLPHSTPQNASRQKASGQSGAGVHEWGIVIVNGRQIELSWWKIGPLKNGLNTIMIL